MELTIIILSILGAMGISFIFESSKKRRSKK
jgi:hypothetical protein